MNIIQNSVKDGNWHLVKIWSEKRQNNAELHNLPDAIFE